MERVNPASPQRLSRCKSFVFGGLVFLLVLVLLELLSLLVLIPLLNLRLTDKIRSQGDIFAEQSKVIRELLEPGQLIEIRPVVGWRYAANYNRMPHRLNGAALRSAREYDPVPPRGVHRVAAFGDSFVYGTEVANPDAWPSVIERENPDLEVLNYGVPGYGVDQAYLRYREEGGEYRPELVLIGFSPNDLSRTVNVYRRFYHSEEVPLFKPRYVLDGQDELSLIECPVSTRADYERLLKKPRGVLAFGRNDQWYEPAIYENPFYDHLALARLFGVFAVKVRRHLDGDRLWRGAVINEGSAAFRIQRKLFLRFAKSVEDRGAKPLVVLLPEQGTLQAVRRGEPPVYEPLIRDLKSRGIDYVDAADAFRAYPVGRWFASGGHYSPEGNRLVALWLAAAIRQRLQSPGG